MNEKEIWDSIGEKYNDEIFSVLHADKNRIVEKQILKYAKGSKIAIDFGCGVGKALPILSANFKQVIAIDISQKLLDQIAKKKYKNVELHCLDLTKKLNLPKADFAFCCNVAICDDNKKNYKMLKNVLKGLKKNGVALIVIPSYESASLSFFNLLKQYHNEGINISSIPNTEINPDEYKLKLISKGISYIEGHPTKHYLLQELYSLFRNKKNSIELLDKVEYNWDTEFTDIPNWLEKPYPWDWICVIKRLV